MEESFERLLCAAQSARLFQLPISSDDQSVFEWGRKFQPAPGCRWRNSVFWIFMIGSRTLYDSHRPVMTCAEGSEQVFIYFSGQPKPYPWEDMIIKPTACMLLAYWTRLWAILWFVPTLWWEFGYMVQSHAIRAMLSQVDPWWIGYLHHLR